MMALLAGEKCKFELIWTSKILILRIADLPDIAKLSRIVFSNAYNQDYRVYNGKICDRVSFIDTRYNYSVVEFFDLDGKPIPSCILLLSEDRFGEYCRLNRGVMQTSELRRCSPLPENLRRLPDCDFAGNIGNHLRVYAFSYLDQIIGANHEFHLIHDDTTCDCTYFTKCIEHMYDIVVYGGTKTHNYKLLTYSGNGELL
jgi:hypothetical protein